MREVFKKYFTKSKVPGHGIIRSDTEQVEMKLYLKRIRIIQSLLTKHI